VARNLEFRVLGPLEAQVEGRPLPLPGRLPRLILATLLLERGRPISADQLVDVLWAADQPKTARNALQVHVSQLRKSLGETHVIASAAAGYAIVLERDELDLERFERLTGEGARLLAAGDAEGAADRLRSALELWRGPALADLRYEASLQPAIHRLEELRMHALERRLDAELALGRHASLVPELEELVAAQPLRERLHAQLMLALYRSARQADALAAFRAARRAFAQELGLEPSPTLRRLEQAILAQDPALELGPMPTADLPTFPQRSLLLALDEEGLAPAALQLARALAGRPARELILALPVGSEAELSVASARANEHRASLIAEGIAARAAAFVSDDPGRDLTRLAVRLDVDLLLVAEEREPTVRLSSRVAGLAEEAPCDLAVLFVRDQPISLGRVVVPFGGETHDWAAVELGAWIARAQAQQLVIAGPRRRRGRRDASRLLADVSLAVQRALGVSVEPVLTNPGVRGLMVAAEGAGLLVAGFPDDWRAQGLGPTRSALVREASVPVVLVRNGVRPSAIAPPGTTTRYTWSLELGSKD
jgi:DNA-binding SARP family transcriptional activator